MTIFELLYRAIRRVCLPVVDVYDHVFTWMLLKGNGVTFSTFRTKGIPKIQTSRGCHIALGPHFMMNNDYAENPIGYKVPCSFIVEKGASITIGNNVGMSQTTIYAAKGGGNIVIGNNVLIGGGVKIYGTSFHSLDYQIRRSFEDDQQARKIAPVYLGDDSFIGAGTTIMCGVTIGAHSIVGAASVVTKDIPSGEIWAGNPAKFIRKV